MDIYQASTEGAYQIKKFQKLFSSHDYLISAEQKAVLKELLAASEEAGALYTSLLQEPQKKQTMEQDIVIAGPLCAGGTYLLGAWYRDILKKQLPGWFVQKALQEFSSHNTYVPCTQKLIKDYQISSLYALGEGGLYKTLYELGKDTGRGYHIYYKDLPLSQLTIEFCECFDMDPLRLFSSGATLLVTPLGIQLSHFLETAYGLPCRVIGHSTLDKNKLLLHAEMESRINRPEPDELLQLIQKI